MQWGLDSQVEDVLQMIPLLSYFWNRRGYEEEGRNLIREALRRAEQLPEIDGEAGRRRQKLFGEAWQPWPCWPTARVTMPAPLKPPSSAAAIARQLDDKHLLALALGFEASGAMFLGNTEGIQALLQEGLAAAKESGDKAVVGLPLAMYAQALGLITGNYRRGHV